MIEKFAVMRGKVSSELLSRHQQQALANFEIGTPA